VIRVSTQLCVWAMSLWQENACVGSWCRLPCWSGAKTAGVGQEGNRRLHSPQRDQRIDGYRCESPMTGSPPLGPGYMTGTKRQLVLGHGLTPAAPRYPKIPRCETRGLASSSRVVGGRARRGGYTGSGPLDLCRVSGRQPCLRLRPRNLSVPYAVSRFRISDWDRRADPRRAACACRH
jgi:hypothetical protein